MKKLYVFFVILVIAISFRALNFIAGSFFPPILTWLVDFLGSIMFYLALAYFCWNTAIYLYMFQPSHESEYPGIIFEDFKIHVDDLGHDVYGTLLSSKQFDENTPLVISMTGGGGKHDDLFGPGVMLVQAGFKVILFDHPGITGKSHGTDPASKILSVPRSILALRGILDYALSRNDIKTSNIGLHGGSLGAFTAVYGGFLDARVKIIIGECVGLLDGAEDMRRLKKTMPWWFKLFCKRIKLDIDSVARLDFDQFSRTNDQSLKNRIYLAHAKDDYAVPYWAFEKLKKALGLPDENCLVFNKGGHYLFYHHDMRTGWIIGILKKHLA